MDELKRSFIEQFGDQGGLTSYFAPARVNLIGEHTDYNGGHVFPCALTLGTYATARKREDRTIRLYSMNFEESGIIEVQLDDLRFIENDDWANYPKGVAAIFQQAGYEIDSGFDVAFYGNIPNGSGLSSSASIEMLTAVILKDLFHLEIGQIEMVKLAQKAENEFIGVNCGIMDQFSIGMGKKNHAILLDCDTLDYQYTPINLKNEKLILANTNKRRGLANSKYNERRQQCEAALSSLQEKLNIKTLGDLTREEFEAHKHLIQDELIRKRAKHAVYENNRTIEAVEKLNAGDVRGFGKLMNESHISLRDDYEVTGKELDVLVEAAWNEGAIGSRMTGAGFGGCTVSIVPDDRVDSFIEAVGKTYKAETGLEAEFYVADIGDQAKKL
ncbi:galactokinase [Pseudalkalibacillus salsuginis]|uniref:galactokinase n=1 Tax=Pseudalkalibacillus salsuginis TaxID=2910972 RepID=UPI001F2D7306|nr:galactokinase [Pseudalkalibacillus salsuginis]MCF6410002.1 galactokinase [Pseudalkalibacillus salsuginis]